MIKKLTNPKQEGPVSYCHIQLDKYIPLLNHAGHCLYLPSLHSCWNHSRHFYFFHFCKHQSNRFPCQGLHICCSSFLKVFLPVFTRKTSFPFSSQVKWTPEGSFIFFTALVKLSYLFVCYLSQFSKCKFSEGKYFVYSNPLGFSDGASG